MGYEQPDVTELVINYLYEGLGGIEVASQVPDPIPDPFVQVMRTGGTADRIIDRAQITVIAWGSGHSGVQASRTAYQVRGMLLVSASADRVPLFRRVEVLAGPYDDDDPRTGRPRFTTTFQITVRARRT